MADERLDPRELAGLSRRELIAAISAVGAAAALGLPERASAATLPSEITSTVRRAASFTPHGSDLGAVEHVVFLMMENRSYDHYFGTYHKGRGFDDHPKHSLGPFAQHYPAGTALSPRKKLLPFHLDPSIGDDCTHDLSHNWGPQHLSWNHGRMNRYVRTHTMKMFEGVPDGALTMGYYTRRDIPLYWALADHFTLCDRYHASVIGPTHPNRVMSLSATIDPAGHRGGPITDTSIDPGSRWTCDWPTMPEVLEDAGISWKVYHPSWFGPNGKYAYLAAYPTWEPILYNPTLNPLVMLASDHVLPYFRAYEKQDSTLHRKAFSPTFPAQFTADVQSGRLPKVSWLIPPLGFDDHPSTSPTRGMWFVRQVIDALTANRKVWSKTVLFLMYDENDGFFDHVPPPTPPKHTHGEWLTAKTISSETMSIRGPVGLGVRVPCIVISPFSRGGHVVSEVFDHTSQLKFLHERFGVEVPNISHWRRKTVGDLTSTLFHHKRDASMPHLPKIALEPPQLTGSCAETNQDTDQGGAAPTIPTKQRMPTQHGTTVSAKRYFKESPTTTDRVPARSGRSTATKKSAYNPLVHGGAPVASREVEQ